MGLKRLVALLLVFVMVGSTVGTALARPTKTIIFPNTKNLSPSDLISIEKINKYYNILSEEKIKKIYEEAVKRAKEQYKNALKKQDELVRKLVKNKKQTVC